MKAILLDRLGTLTLTFSVTHQCDTLREKLSIV
jgi:hypothetical protein